MLTISTLFLIISSVITIYNYFFSANFGIFCSTPGIPLVRNVARKTAMYMLFTGLSISGREAYDVGLVSKVVPKEKFGKLLKDLSIEALYTLINFSLVLFYT